MTGNKCCLDTSVIIHAFRNQNDICKKLLEFETIFVSTTVLGELYYGAYCSKNYLLHIKQIESFLTDCIVIPASNNTSTIYGQIKSVLRKNGTPIPENDIWIAASAIDLRLPLFTSDKHFKFIEMDLILF